MGSAWMPSRRRMVTGSKGMGGSQAEAQRKATTQTGPGVAVPLLLLLVTRLCLTLCAPKHCRLPDCSVRGISQA